MTQDRAVECIVKFESLATKLRDLLIEAEITLRTAQEQGIFTLDGSVPEFIAINANKGCVESTNVSYGVFHVGGEAAYVLAEFMATHELSNGKSVRSAIERLSRP